MRVVILGTAYPYRGGLSAFNERLARQFMHEGHDVEIITFTLQYPSFLFPGKTQYSDEPAPADLKITRMVNSCNPFNWIRVGRKIARMKPDILVTKYWLPFMAPCLGTIARRAHWYKKLRRISILDNIVPHEHRPGDKLFSRYFVHSTDGFVAMSRSVYSDLSLFDTKKPRTLCLHPIYDYGEKIPRAEALSRIGLRENAKYILFFGFIRDYKGLDILLDAMVDPRIDHLGIKLIVAGEFYGDPTPYNGQLVRLGIGDKVVMHTDFIPDSEVNQYFCAADVVVQPYKSATQSGVTQIAFHFEKPMIVTNVGGLPEIVPDGKAGFVVEPDSQQIADAIVKYFEENQEERMTEYVREEKKKYAWTNMISAILNLK